VLRLATSFHCLFFYFYGHNEDQICSVMPRSFPNLYSYYYIIVTYVFYFGIPFSAILFANIVFIRSLKKRKTAVNKKDANKTNEKSKQEQRKLQAERNYVTMLLFLTCSLCIFAIGWYVLYVLNQIQWLEAAWNFELFQCCAWCLNDHEQLSELFVLLHERANVSNSFQNCLDKNSRWKW